MKSIENFIRDIVKSHIDKKFSTPSNINRLKQQLDKLTKEANLQLQ